MINLNEETKLKGGVKWSEPCVAQDGILTFKDLKYIYGLNKFFKRK